MFWGKKQRLGIDFGTYTLKCCLAGSDACHVREALTLPERSAREQTLDDPVKRLQGALAECQKALPGWSRKVTAGLSDEGSVTGYLELPALSAKEMAVAVPAAVVREIPYPLEEVELYQLQVPALTSGKTGLFFAAVPKTTVETARRVLAAVELEPRRLEPALFAVVRHYGKNHAVGPEPVAVIDAGYRATRVVVLRHGVPYFFRDFPVAGGDFTYAFQMGHQVSWSEAEEQKRAYNVFESDEYLVEPFLQRWLDEVKRSLEGQGVTRVWLGGGSANWPGLPERLQKHLGLPVEREAWDKLTPSVPAPAASYAVAIGLALAE